MSLDDYVRRLTTTITQELEAPIEQSLRVLLGEVMERARHDREEAVRGLEEQLATLRADFEATESRAEGERQSLLEQHAAALAALREEVTAEVGQAVLLEATQMARTEQAAAEEALRTQLAGEREAAEEALRAQLTGEREAAERALREQLMQEREAAGQALRAELTSERETAEQALRDELTRQHEQQMLELEEAHQRALVQLRDEVTAEVGQAVLSEAQRSAREEQAAAEEALRAQLMGERVAAEQVLRAQFTAERESAEQAIRQAVASDYDERLEEARAQQAPAGEDRLVAALRDLDRATTLTDALGALLGHASHESGRTALFLVSGERIRGWRQAGFGADVAGIDLPLHVAGPLGLAVQTADPVLTTEYRAGESSLPSWLLPQGGHSGAAMPVSVGGRVVAVLYAEGHQAPAIEVLTRHAGRCLEVLTFSRVTAPPSRSVPVPIGDEDVRRSGAGPESDSVRQEESARRYARLLISELKLYNESAVEEGRQHHDLLARLGPEVERARRLYEEKIPAVVRERAGWFDEELVRTLAGGDASMLGQVT